MTEFRPRSPDGRKANPNNHVSGQPYGLPLCHVCLTADAMQDGMCFRCIADEANERLQ